MDAHALPLQAATLVLPRRDAKTALPVAMAAAAATVVVLLAAATAMTVTAVCLLVVAATLPHTLLETPMTDTALLPAVAPSRPLPCVVTPTIATDEDLPLRVTTLPVIATTSLPPVEVVPVWTTRLATSRPAAHPVTTLHPVEDTVTCLRPLPAAVEDTKTCPLRLPARVVRVAGTTALPDLVMTMLVRLPVATERRNVFSVCIRRKEKLIVLQFVFACLLRESQRANEYVSGPSIGVV